MVVKHTLKQHMFKTIARKNEIMLFTTIKPYIMGVLLHDKRYYIRLTDLATLAHDAEGV